MTDKFEKGNVQIKYFPTHKMWGISWQRQRKEKILETLETTYLEEINEVELVSEGNGKNICTNMRECSVVWY